ncbi:hypothetical protein SELMODRAFT_272018 [Selaginella moellendorffii]|uniref:Uncharacterized protein n=1 Tax=Selaginella moellendorffii TaxID=88036 RepID=D8SZ98_SELML|nr:uncharacterized protein LOC9639308 [Selaginella moellendorffii]EFJ10172.1 hypothetical protein SELMODRAFT_272018 [Selaginella moellendorffii]|eukprot:XP_002988661.1 uncharacterized protein LOC9639308 [Selaginella moellendorffii]
MALEGWRFRAANFFFLIIVFGLQLFNVPCSKGSCSSPMEVVADFLYSKKLASDIAVKALLYPSAFLAKAEVVLGDSNDGFSLPDWKNLLRDFKRKPKQSSDPLGLVFVAGCFSCLLGAFLSAFGITFLSPAGTLVVLWYVYTAGKTDPSIHLLPMFSLAVLCSIAAFNLDIAFKAKVSSGEKLEAKQD